MHGFGQRSNTPDRPPAPPSWTRFSAQFGAILAGIGALSMWGFTVDDAFIPLRYAAQLRAFGTYRLSEGSATSDGVTPLPLALLLLPFGSVDPLRALVLWKATSLAFFLASALWASRHLQGDVVTRFVLGALLVAPLPVAAHAGAGLETGVVIALTMFCSGAFARHPLRALVFAGLAASLRPELIVFSVALLLMAALRERKDRPTLTKLAAWTTAATLPFLLCVASRLVKFGAPIPLSVLAKPADLWQGSVYALVACIVCATPVLGVLAIIRGGTGRYLALAGFAGVVAVAFAGGDWMPYGRLLAPLGPVFVFAFSESRWSPRPARIASALVALLATWPWITAAPRGRAVLADRSALIAEARELLGNHIATVDVGWPTAAKPHATIMDLAGLTDVQIAHLRGSHTSKNVDASMILDRRVDTILLYASSGKRGSPYDSATYGRETDFRLAKSELLHEHFVERAFVPLGTGPSGYYVLRKK